MTGSCVTLRARAGGALSGRLRVPGDKSISHRAIMLGAIAQGVTRVSGFLEGEDTLATLTAFQQMGVDIERPGPGELLIHGVGLKGLRAPRSPLHLGNSGTSMRLLAGLLAGQLFDSELGGDDSLSKRPMKRIAEPLSRMGARITCHAGDKPPLRITGGQNLTGIDYTLPVASAQIKSSLLLAGLYASGETRITEPGPSRDHTERMLQRFGYPVRDDNNSVCIDSGGSLKGCVIEVPADLSSAAFFLVGAAIAPGSELILESVGINPTRSGVIDVLRMMGADILVTNPRDKDGEPVADLHVRSASLTGITIPEDKVALSIDEFPALFIAAACASGETVLTGAKELRFKESDRIQVMAEGLQALGIDAKSMPDGIIIQGGELNGGVIDSQGDHRVAMAFAIAGLRARAPIELRDCANIDTSYPEFVAHARRIGLSIENMDDL